jgi:DNA-binding NarL/FixJ family response regulator
MTRILIADDHAILRKGLRRILTEMEGGFDIDEASNGHEVIKMVREKDYDLVLLDISMPGLSGLDALKEIKVLNPRLPVLILTMHPEEQYALRALKAGASGYLTKESVPDELMMAIRKVLRGGKYLSNSLAERLAFAFDEGADRPPHELLSDREYQVFCLIAAGKGLTEIAEEMSLSVKTVSTYRSRILEKMKMKSNAELIHYAIKNKLV